VETEGRKQLTLPGTREALRQVADAFDAFGLEHGLPEDLVHSVQIALDELVSNTVRHGYEILGTTGEIEVSFLLRSGMLELDIIDDAPAFNPLAAPEPDLSLPIEERPIGGLGLLLVRELMDRVEYERRDDKNCMKLWKRVVAETRPEVE